MNLTDAGRPIMQRQRNDSMKTDDDFYKGLSAEIVRLMKDHLQRKAIPSLADREMQNKAVVTLRMVADALEIDGPFDDIVAKLRTWARSKMSGKTAKKPRDERSEEKDERQNKYHKEVLP